MASVIDSIVGEYRRYKALAEGAMGQLSDEQLVAPGRGGGNSIATICRHVAGNLNSRFTEFLTTDGEKPWRDREDEFSAPRVGRADLLAEWEAGWAVLFATLGELSDADLGREVKIRGQGLSVTDALARSLSHTSYHVGQVVYAARALLGTSWKYLSIPPGGSAAFNASPTHQRPADHAAWVKGQREK